MPCQIVIRTLNGIVPVGGTQPNRVRVTGTAFNCPGGVLLTSNATAPMSAPAPVDPNDRFLIDVPIAPPGSVSCGDSLGVTVTCAADPNCSATRPAQPLLCCEVQIVTVDGIVPQGQLNPVAIRVAGTLYGCPTDQVTITIPGITAPRTVQVPPILGSFDEQLPVTAPSLTCGTVIDVIAECVSVSGCRAERRMRPLPCSQCFRAYPSLTAGPCTGPTGSQTQAVTLQAQIGLPANGTGTFVWDYGDGAQGAPFPVTISSGAPGAVVTVTEPPHSYAARPAPYTAELRRIDVSECPPVPITFPVTCNRCPQVAGSVVVGACETSGNLAGSRPVTYTLSFTPPLGATDTAYANLSYGGTDVATGASAASVQRTGPGTLVHTAYLLPKAGGYSSTASVTIVDAQGVALCLPPLPPITFTTRPTAAPPGVDVDPCLPCPDHVQVAVTQPNPSVSVWQFAATVVWPNATPPPPPPHPAGYDWTVTLPNGTEAKITNGSATVTTQGGWTGPGATSTGAVDISQGGTYSVSATAKYAPSAGLPVDPITGLVTCNLTAGGNFVVTGSPPSCPQITGVQVTTPNCADETQGIAATIGLTASVTNPGAAIGQYQWDFGDPSSPSNTASTAAPTAQHGYTAPGSYVVTVSVAAPASCPPTSVQATITVGRCPCPEGQSRDSAGNCVSTSDGDGDEGAGCMLLRWVGALLIMLGLFAFIVWLCIPNLPQWASYLILGIAIGLVLAGIIVLLIWAALCPIKPCLWGLLLAWQILLGFGLVALYFTICCWWLWIVGGVSIVIALILLGIWIYRCQPTFCQVIIELAPVLSNVLALIGVVAAVPILSACLNKAVGAVVGGVSAALVVVLASCAAAGTKTKTGPPVN